MPGNGWSPGIVPFGADETAYLVVDSFSNGTVYRETEIENADALKIVQSRDDRKSFFYLDPPYFNASVNVLSAGGVKARMPPVWRKGTVDLGSASSRRRVCT